MDSSDLELGLELGQPRLAWQPAEHALTVMPEPSPSSDRRRSTMVSIGMQQKDVQWQRIRELTDTLQKERDVSAGLTTRFHEFQREASAKERQLQQLVEAKEQMAMARAAELEAHREAARTREQQLLDDVAEAQERARTLEDELGSARAEAARAKEALDAAEAAHAEELAARDRLLEADELDADGIAGKERGLEVVERALLERARGAKTAAAAEQPLISLDDEAGDNPEDAGSSRTSVARMIADGRSGLEVARALVDEAACSGRAEVEDSVEQMARRWRQERTVRRQLQNTLQEIKGSIRVMCRVRPLSNAERERSTDEVVQLSNDMACTLVDPSKPSARRHFGYDRVFGAAASQAEVFDEVQPLVQSVFDGQNLCIFAYGQTGSGKTHTMQGSHDDPGVGPRLLGAVFTEAAERRALAEAARAEAAAAGGGAGGGAGGADADDWEYAVSVSYLEVYNEAVRDLLAPGPKPVGVDVRQASGTEVHIPNLTQVSVSSAEEVTAALRTGASKRAVGATNMNAHSSRSHSLVLATITGRHARTGAAVSGKMYLVDLAGSERVGRSGAAGERMTEAQNINKSLSALGDVMAALQSKASHVPYRNSKLTQLLADCLGGRSKSIMFVNVAPTADSAGETLCSLQFASRVGSVELASAKRPGAAGGGGGGAALALKLSRDSEDKLRAELIESKDRLAAAERRGAEASAALAEAQRLAAEELECAQSEREGVEFAARAEADRLSAELAQEVRRRELAEAAAAKAADAASAEVGALRAEVERARGALEMAHAAAASAVASGAAGAPGGTRALVPSAHDKAAAVAALRQQAMAARSAAGGGGGAAAAASAGAATAQAQPPPVPAPEPMAPAAPAAPLVDVAVMAAAAAPTPPPPPAGPVAAPPVSSAPEPPAATSASAAPASKLVRFAEGRTALTDEPAAAAAQGTPARAAAAAARAPAASTPRAAAAQLRAMPAVQALYGANALTIFEDAPTAQPRKAEPPPSAEQAESTLVSVHAGAGAEKENAANDSRSTVTGELAAAPPGFGAGGGAPHSALKPSLKQSSVLGGGMSKAGAAGVHATFASTLPTTSTADAHCEADKIRSAVASGTVAAVRFNFEPSYAHATNSSSSRFGGLGGAQRVAAGSKAAARGGARMSEAGGRGGNRRMSLVARQSLATDHGFRRQVAQPWDDSTGMGDGRSHKRKRF